MSEVKRIYVEKKADYHVEGAGLLNEFKHLLGISGLTSVRLLNRYDIEGIKEEDYEKAKNTIFSEPPVDLIYEEEFLLNEKDSLLCYEYLPGQYDQRADSASQCIQLLSEDESVTVKSAKVLVLSGDIGQDDIDKITSYVVNPVEARVASMDKPDTLGMTLEPPGAIAVLKGFISMEAQDRERFMAEKGLAMNLEDLAFVQDYFKNVEKRNPTITEIRVIDTYWSDHCRHTTFLTQIDDILINDSIYLDRCKETYDDYIKARKFIYDGKKEKPVCLMDIALAAMKQLKKQGKLTDLEETDEINACSIVITADIDGKPEEWLIMFKNETHNHPTEIEPFGGAATCLGGAIRDPLSGRAYVYQAMRVTGSADPTKKIEETLEGKLPQVKITREAAHGYSSYGNQIGLSTGLVEEIYDEKYMAKRMEIGAVIAATPRKNVFRGKALPGDAIVLLGGRTGRDGCGGATGSSKEHTEESLATCAAEVQKGNPPTERKIQRLFRNEKASSLIKVCNDFGAGGVAVAIGEIAPGLIIELDKVRKKYDGLDGTELAISESQERMAVVVEKENMDQFITYAENENLEAYQVAEVTRENRLVMKWNQTEIVNIDRDFLDTNGVTQHVNAEITAPDMKTYFDEEINTDKLENKLKKRLSSLESCSRKGLVERFDSTVGASTVLMPFGGTSQLTPQEGMAAKIPTLSKTDTATLMTFGFNPKISSWSPFHGAVYAVLESVAKIAAMGGNVSRTRLTFQEYFEKLYKNEQRWGKPLAALLGAYYAQKEFEIAAIGGKDSMSGTFKDIDVPPTLVSFAVNVTSAGKIVSAEFKNEVSEVVLVRIPVNEDYLPDLKEARSIYMTFHQLVKENKILAASTVKEGGILECVAKMGFGNHVGFSSNGTLSEDEWMTSNYGCIIAQVKGETPYEIIGNTNQNGIIAISDETIAINELISSWKSKLEEVFPTEADKQTGQPLSRLHDYKERIILPKGIAKPGVFIPVFPGTNCEYDVEKAFIKAGAKSAVDIFRNMSASDIHSSVERIVTSIKNSQMIAFPGGFSAGDEPEGSGKFIATVFRNAYIKEAVLELLNKRDGLIIGICNGFQVLIKLGLVPYGTIIDMHENSPTLTFNKIGRHVSCMVNTKIISNKSPWLASVKPGDVHTIPISHGEGRFVASEDIIRNLFDNGQVATQYVDSHNQPTYDIAYNPNGSYHAIEGITSLDGRVFGKMGHSERMGEDICKNVPGNKDQLIFESGVKYFK
ncbi:MAG: phosphoribosylformylglycinamidine synthase [Clostridia bacterium]|nr:phosphoribosylformylglycinamidine synthase [Clostridia bacterium]